MRPLPGRDTWLGAAFAGFAAAFLLQAVSSGLAFAFYTQPVFPAGEPIGEALDALGNVTLAVAFAVGFAAFQRAPERAGRYLRVATVLALVAVAIVLAARLATASVSFTHAVSAERKAHDIVELIESGLMIVAAILAVLAFAPRLGPPAPLGGGAVREDQLAGAALAVGAGLLFGTIAQVLAAVEYGHARGASGLATGTAVGAAGGVIGTAAAALGALAFFRAFRHYDDEGWLAARDWVLWVAASVLCAGFLVLAVGAIVFAAAASGSFGDGRLTAGAWVLALAYLAEMAAAACAAVGFARSRDWDPVPR